MSEFGVIAEKSAGAEQYRAVAVVGKLGNHAVVQRRRVEEDFGTREHRQQASGREAKGMEQRQCVEDLVVDGKINHGADLRDVGEQSAVR